MIEESADLDNQKLKSCVLECLKTSSEAVKCAQSFLSDVLNEKDRNGISLFEVKNHDLLLYMSELALLMCQMGYGRSIQGSDAVERSVYLRTVVERIRPIEMKLKSQVEKLTSMAFGKAKKAAQTLHPRPELMKLDENEANGSGTSEDEKTAENPKIKKYVPPKLVAVPYDEDDQAKEARKLEQIKKRALQSSLIQELRLQYGDAPEEIVEERANRKTREADLERQKYEEDYFVRLQVSKKERHKRKLESRQNIIEDLLHFGDYMAADTLGGKSKDFANSFKKRKIGKRKAGNKANSNKAVKGKRRVRK